MAAIPTTRKIAGKAHRRIRLGRAASRCRDARRLAGGDPGARVVAGRGARDREASSCGRLVADGHQGKVSESSALDLLDQRVRCRSKVRLSGR